MSPILFYGVPEGCSFGSIVALEWIGRPYRLCRVQMPEVVASDAYARINPARETPTLRTADGRFVSESMAILQHLAPLAVEQGLAFRQGTADFDRLNQALAYLNTSYFNAYTPLWYALEHEADGAQGDMLREYGRALVGKAHAHLERRLADGPWLLGPAKTFADAYFAGIARWADFHGVADWSRYPRLAALRARLADDPAVQYAWAVEHEEAHPGSGACEGHVSLDEMLRELGAQR